MKINTLILVITTIVCLLPIILALVIYDDLPDQVTMQWNLSGNPNWSAPKAVAAFGMPVFFAMLNIIIITLMHTDSRRKNIPEKMMAIVQWIVPAVTLVTVPIILLAAIGIELPIILIVFILVGVIFILIGSYMPKCKQNYSVGIRITWTLSDSENWNKTHKLAGLLWTLGGFIFIILAFLPLDNYIFIVLLLSFLAVLTLTPLAYSYFLYRKNAKLQEK
ncbi:MAG: SdpI family protein [Treponema sp.]|jgi:uncharacterized membrane protein|nr:SdpI family protein [Treponema sp.]